MDVQETSEMMIILGELRVRIQVGQLLTGSLVVGELLETIFCVMVCLLCTHIPVKSKEVFKICTFRFILCLEDGKVLADIKVLSRI